MGGAQSAEQASAGAGAASSSSSNGGPEGACRIALAPVQPGGGAAAVERIELLIGACLQSILRRSHPFFTAPTAGPDSSMLSPICPLAALPVCCTGKGYPYISKNTFQHAISWWKGMTS